MFYKIHIFTHQSKTTTVVYKNQNLSIKVLNIMGVKNVTSTRIVLKQGLTQLCIAVLDSLIKPSQHLLKMPKAQYEHLEYLYTHKRLYLSV